MTRMEHAIAAPEDGGGLAVFIVILILFCRIGRM